MFDYSSILRMKGLNVDVIDYNRAVTARNSHQRGSVKKVLLRISENLQKNICARVSFLIKLQVNFHACKFIKKETQIFSCEFCQISKNTFLTEHLWTIVCQVEGYQNILKLSCRPLAFTSYKAFSNFTL